MRKRYRVNSLSEDDINIFYLKIFNECLELFPDNLQKNLTYIIRVNQSQRILIIYYQLIKKVGLYSLSLRIGNCYLPRYDNLRNNIVLTFWDQLYKGLLPVDEQMFLLDNIDIVRDIRLNIGFDSKIDTQLRSNLILDFYNDLLKKLDDKARIRVESWIVIERMSEIQRDK